MSVIDRLPEHLKNRKTAEAVTAPSALLLAGAGTAAGVLIGAGLPLAILVGAVAYGVRVAFGLPRKPRPERIDLAGLSQPWRAYVKDAMEAPRAALVVGLGRGDDERRRPGRTRTGP